MSENSDLKDRKKYSYVKHLIDTEQIQTINELFEALPKKLVAKALGRHPTNYSTNRAKKIEDFKLREIMQLSIVLKVNPLKLFKLYIESTKIK